MPNQEMETNAPRATPIAPGRPAEVLCAPIETPTHRDPDHADEGGRRPRAKEGSRPPVPPGRPLDEVMRAFREQRRLTKEEGEAGAVIAQILAQRGGRSLTDDLAKQEQHPV